MGKAEAAGLETKTVEDLKKLNKNKKLIKKLARSFTAFLASDSVRRAIPRLLGPGLNRAGKFPGLLKDTDSIKDKVRETRSSIRFQFKKVTCTGVAVGNVKMDEKQIYVNVQIAINFLVTLLKRNWQNVKCLYLKTTMGRPFRIL